MRLFSINSSTRARLAVGLVCASAYLQLGATSLDPLTRSAWRAVEDFAYAPPLQDPTEVLAALAIDPLVRANRAEAMAAELRRARKRPQLTGVQVDGVSDLVAHRVASSLAMLDAEPIPTVNPRAFSFSRLLARRVAPSTNRRRAQPSAVVATAIGRAASRTGVSSGYLFRAAARESSFDPNARASTSSALGLYQFLDDTWLRTVKRYGPAHGYGHLASKIDISASGKATVADAYQRYEVLAARRDPYLSALMGAEFTRENQAVLRAGLGRHPSDGETYIAHFLGAEGAVRLLQAARHRPGASAAELFPRAASANRSIFYDRYGRARSAPEVAAILRAKGTA